LGKEIEPAGCRRGAKPLSIDYLPLPLDKGKGIKGIGFKKKFKAGEVKRIN
jgi:hypothetical protein